MKIAFLPGTPRRSIGIDSDLPATSIDLALGNGASGLEIVIANCTSRPTIAQCRAAWIKRKANRPAPVLLVAVHDGGAIACGFTGDTPQVWTDISVASLDAICREALAQTDRHAAVRALRDSLPAAEAEVTGIRNEGFLATHVLASGAAGLAGLDEAGRKARTIIGSRGTELLGGLGYSIEPHDRVTSILRAAERRTALAVLLNQDESPEAIADRFSRMSPISYALSVAHRENLPWVLIQHGNKIRIYPADIGVGIGRGGRTETWLECHLGLLGERDMGLLWLVFSAEALAPDGSLRTLIAASGRFAGDLATGLRDRIYRKVIPLLARGLAEARKIMKPDPEQLAQTYRMAMVILFRVLFIAYAEDKDLLPYQWNELYRSRSLKAKARELLKLATDGIPFDATDSLWQELCLLFRSVEKGRREWGVPAYDGGLFSEDPDISPIGASLASISLDNTVLGPTLAELLLADTPEGRGPTDFRSLSVGEFGTIYEGLLESELSVAEVDLAAGDDEVYRPTIRGEEPVVLAGEIYLHNASGARKSSGTFFTKSFAVDHLLDRALEPALREHLASLEKLKDSDAGERFFDFAIADIAMGSGHFLVAAIDRIERAFAGALAQRPIAGVTKQIDRLRENARKALGYLAEGIEIEDAQLLRRLIARRCVFGVDINPTAMELARLAVWIHTFVPGLPLSLLDHNLVCGNSLVGIGNIDEAIAFIQRSGDPLFPIDAEHLLGQARGALTRFAHALDDTPGELHGARNALHTAMQKIGPASALFDVISGCRMAGEDVPPRVAKLEHLDDSLIDSTEHRRAMKAFDGLAPFHFPVSFPEVFLRARPGFDVIVGNPPWQEATLEEDAFWARHSPGLRSLPQREQEKGKVALRKKRPDLLAMYQKELAEAEVVRRALTRGDFPGMDTGDPDLYKAFCWRFWHLAREGGHVGVVLPRSALSAKGSTEFRQMLLNSLGELDITMLLNNKQWFFEDVHPQYTIGLLEYEKAGPGNPDVNLRGPYSGYDRYLAGLASPPAVFSGEEITSWNDTASLPLLPSEKSVEVFTQLRKAPRLDRDKGKEWRTRPHRELDATNDKYFFDLQSKEKPTGFWPVYKGESFDLWNPDTGTYYAWANPSKLIPVLQKKRLGGISKGNSVFNEFNPNVLKDESTLPCLHPRLAFRDVSRATDSRTMRVALVPPEVFLANQSPYLLWIQGDEKDQAFVLGILSSLPLDWYTRRYVETHMNYFVLNPLPIPRPSPDHSLRLRTIELAGRLACPDKRFEKWAKKVGVECGKLAEDQKEDMIRELDAVCAHLYGLDEAQLVHVFETFHEGWDFADRLSETIRHYQSWRKRL